MQNNINDMTSHQAIKLVANMNDEYKTIFGERPGAYVLTFGCQQNEADSERFAGMAQAMGYEVKKSPDGVKLIIVNTCAIREHAEQKALSIIGQFKHLKAKDPELVICVGGCMVAQQHRADEIKHKYPYVDFTFTPAHLAELPVYLYNYRKSLRRNFVCEDGYTKITEGIPAKRESGYRAWVSIMYGCNNFCSYCIVPYVRGRERSRDWREVYSEVEQLAKAGYKDITLLGQNVNSYNGGMSFAELLEKLSEIEGDFLIRFMTSHPKDASDALIDVMSRRKKIAPHFHLPMQSGSDAILKRMNRHYDRERYVSIVKKLRECIPNIAITTDIIVGFPGESDEDFEDTLSLVREARFDMIYSFLFSPRKSTPAYDMPNQIPSDVKSARFSKLIELQNSISLENNKKYLSQAVRVLCDGRADGAPHFSGRTDTNKIVHFDCEVPIGSFVTLKITKAETFALYGEPINEK